jgi:hypothetical protein
MLSQSLCRLHLLSMHLKRSDRRSLINSHNNYSHVLLKVSSDSGQHTRNIGVHGGESVASCLVSPTLRRHVLECDPAHTVFIGGSIIA